VQGRLDPSEIPTTRSKNLNFDRKGHENRARNHIQTGRYEKRKTSMQVIWKNVEMIPN